MPNFYVTRLTTMEIVAYENVLELKRAFIFLKNPLFSYGKSSKWQNWDLQVTTLNSGATGFEVIVPKGFARFCIARAVVSCQCTVFSKFKELFWRGDSYISYQLVF